MRRRPNPWIVGPALGVGLLAGLLGWFVTDLSCTTTDPVEAVTHCYGWAAVVSVSAFAVVTAGMLLVLILVYRSLGEWRDAQAKAREIEGPD